MLPPSMNGELARQYLNERLDHAHRRRVAGSATPPMNYPARQRLGRWMIRVGLALNPGASPSVAAPMAPDTAPAT